MWGIPHRFEVTTGTLAAIASGIVRAGADYIAIDGLRGWSIGRITVRVRYSRGADFSGTCFYADRRVFINLGKHLRYPYKMNTNVAKAQRSGYIWRRPMYTMELRDAYQLALFIFMHELYHLLVKRAGRNTRQKEAMCDQIGRAHV